MTCHAERRSTNKKSETQETRGRIKIKSELNAHKINENTEKVSKRRKDIFTLAKTIKEGIEKD